MIKSNINLVLTNMIKSNSSINLVPTNFINMTCGIEHRDIITNQLVYDWW